MKTYGYFDNQKLENTEVDINYLNGILTAFQFINNKIDVGFDFSLNKFKKEKVALVDDLEILYSTTDLLLKKIEIYEVKDVLTKWIFSFLPEIINKSPTQQFLIDRRDNFELSHLSSRSEFVEEFVFTLHKAINPTNIYSMNKNHSRFTRRITLGNDFDVICFETQEDFYILSLSWDD